MKAYEVIDCPTCGLPAVVTVTFTERLNTNTPGVVVVELTPDVAATCECEDE